MRTLATTTLSIVCLAGLTLNGCATDTSITSKPEQAIVWPSPPAQARIAYVRSFAKPDDLDIGRGFFRWLSDLFTGAQQNRLIRPMAVVLTASDQIFVADPGARGVHRFDRAQREYRLVARAGEQILPSPVGLALGPDNSVYVVDSELAQVFQIRAGEEIAQPVFSNIKFNQPSGIAYDTKTGFIYVTDTAKHQIVIINRAGEPIKTFGQRGSNDGEFNFPTYLWLDAKQRLFVTDSLNFRVQLFDQNGNYLSKFGQHGDGTGNFSRPKGIATDKFGHIYVVDGLFNAIQIFDEEGNLLLPVGQRGHSAGEFYLPTGIFLNNSSEIYVADSHNQRVQVLRYLGDHP